jgi:hypothetical protein
MQTQPNPHTQQNPQKQQNGRPTRPNLKLSLSAISVKQNNIQDGYVQVYPDIFVGSEVARNNIQHSDNKYYIDLSGVPSTPNPNLNLNIHTPTSPIFDKVVHVFNNNIIEENYNLFKIFIEELKLSSLLKKNPPVYINCQAGISRSVTLATILAACIESEQKGRNLTTEELMNLAKSIIEKRYSKGIIDGETIQKKLNINFDEFDIRSLPDGSFIKAVFTNGEIQKYIIEYADKVATDLKNNIEVLQFTSEGKSVFSEEPSSSKKLKTEEPEESKNIKELKIPSNQSLSK